MSSDVKFFCVIFLIIFVLKESIATYEQQFLGDYLTDEEYENQEKCQSKFCLLDSDELFSAATQNSSIRPCDDFKEFAMGTFLKYRALNERYTTLGFYQKVIDLYFERLRKLLKRPIIATEPEVFKILKSYFQKCTNSNLIRESGAKDITLYLMKLGGSPLLSNGSWNDEPFDIPTLFTREPDFAIKLFLGHSLMHCVDPRNISREILCFENVNSNVVTTSAIDTKYILKHLRLDSATTEEKIDSLVQFLSYTEDLRATFSDGSYKVINIRDIKMIPTMDWLKIINSQLMSDSQVTEDEEILIRNFEKMEGFAEFMMSENKSVIADVFALGFLTLRRSSFIVYPHLKFDAIITGTDKSLQRHETCIRFLNVNMKPALDALFAETYYEKDLQESAESFAMDAVADVVNAIEKADIDNIEAKKIVINKLNSIKYIIMCPDEILNRTKIAEIYDELDLDGSESLLKMELNMIINLKKLKTEKYASWKKKLIDIVQEFRTKYFTDENILYVPNCFSLYPYYHKNRPRFFNMATLHSTLFDQLNYGAKKHLREDFNINLRLADRFISADESYLRWEANGGRDLHLSSFKLTSRQMLWLAMAHANTLKYQGEFQIDHSRGRHKLANIYIHVLFKRTENFRQAFGCQELNELEEMKLANYTRDVNAVLAGN